MVSNATTLRPKAAVDRSSSYKLPSVSSQVRTWVRGRTQSVLLQALTYTGAMGLLVNFGNQGAVGFIPGGYNAGNSDHMVLSTLGIHWADPTKFAGDWFMTVSPQPHWFFDLITYFGASSNKLGTIYFVFWLVGLLCFGLATALLSRHWAPANHWILGTAVTFVMSLAPWNSVGTGNALIAFAVPAVVGGHMVYLFLAMLNTGHAKLAAFFAPVIAVVHVQQGAVICILLIALTLTRYTTRAGVSGPLWWHTVGALVITGSVVAFGLALRPVASKLVDFVEICEVMIPYHCAAHQWSLPLVYSSLALIMLAGMTLFYVKSDERLLWAASIGLPCVGLGLGLLFDTMQVPLLGPLFQGTNVYRLGAIVFPFAIFGIFVAIARSRANLRGVLVGQTAFVCMFLYLGHYGWQLDEPMAVPFILLLFIITVVVLLARFRFNRDENPWPARLGLVGFIGLFAANAIAADALTPRPLNTSFISDTNLRYWGQRVEALVPPGEQILTAPQWTVKTPTSRGVVADCKNVPYGGKAWREWQERISDLGGIDQCRAPYSQDFALLDAEQLDALATKYSTKFAVLDVTQEETFRDLERLGWDLVLEPTDALSFYLWAKS